MTPALTVYSILRMSCCRHISRVLLLIVTLTIMSPHFAWEAMAPDAHHDAGNGNLVLVDAQDHEGDHPSFDHHDEHACSGHMFSHLPAQVSGALAPLAIAAAGTFAHFDETPVPSRVPALLERPPRSRFA